MQINPFGFPLGAGTPPASALAAGGLGFVDALGFAIDSGAPVVTGLTGSTTMPAHFDAKLAQTLLANAQRDAQPMPVAAALPGLQQTTSLSQLMATAAKLPTAEQAPATEIAAPLAEPAMPQPESTQLLAVEPEAVQPEIAQPEVVQPAPAADVEPAKPALPAAQPAVVAPVQTPGKPPVEAAAVALPAEAEAQPETPAVEAAPVKPQKRVRAAAAEADVAPEANATAPAPAPVATNAVVPQVVATQPQLAPREAATVSVNGNAAAPAKKSTAAPTAFEGTPQGTTGTADFADAVVAQGGKSNADTNADGQPRPEFVAGTALKHDAAAPLPTPASHAAHAATSADPVRAPAPAAPAPHVEPVIDAHRHLGQSLGVEIARKVELGEETLRIRLNPIELGRIEVTLAFDDKGSLQATVRAESPQAMDLLRQDAGDLARTLDQAGVRTDAQSFRFENRGGDSGGQQAQQQQSANRGQFAASDDDAAVAEPIYRPVRTDGQVDLLA